MVTTDVMYLYTNIRHKEHIAAGIHFMEEYKHLLPTNCPPPHIVRIILDFILKHSTFKFMDTHIHQILGTSMGTRMAPPYANLFMGKEERTIILTFLHLIYFWKRFIDDIFFIFLGSHSQLNSLMTFMNTISPTIKYTFIYSKQTVTFLDVKIYLKFTLHKHMVPQSKTPRATFHTHPHTARQTYPHIATVVTPVFSSIPDTPNSSWSHGQWIERQDILPNSWYHPTTMWHANAPTLMLLIWEVQSRISNVNIFISSNITLRNV